MSNMLPLQIQHLSCFYQQPVLHDISLQVAPGEFMALLGPSGCGKSTLLRAIAGLVVPRHGCIQIAGECVARDGMNIIPVEQRKVGLVFQDYALFPFQNVRDNIAFGLPNKTRADKKARQARVDELLALIGMADLADRLPGELSGGQQQRVAIARALAPRPQLLLLDEPFANVDSTLRQQLISALQALVAHEGVSVLFVTHDRNEAFALADKVTILMPSQQGSVVAQCAPPEVIYQKPVNADVALLAGPAFLLEARAHGMQAHTAFGQVPLQNYSMGNGQVVVRPEMAEFSQHIQGNAKILARIFQGCHYHLLVETPSGQLYAETRLKTPPAVGTRGFIKMIEPCWWLQDDSETLQIDTIKQPITACNDLAFEG